MKEKSIELQFEELESTSFLGTGSFLFGFVLGLIT